MFPGRGFFGIVFLDVHAMLLHPEKGEVFESEKFRFAFAVDRKNVSSFSSQYHSHGACFKFAQLLEAEKSRKSKKSTMIKQSWHELPGSCGFLGHSY